MIPTVVAKDPLSSNVKTVLSREYSLYPDNYTHTIQAYGGFDRASITIQEDLAGFENWLEFGIGRHIEARSEIGIVWEGFVNQVSATFGSVSFTRGPLMDMANRVTVTYSTTDFSVSPPAIGVRAWTDDADDTDSQALYGIIPAILSCGTISETMAETYRDIFLANRKFPKTTKSLSRVTGGQNIYQITIECLGYFHWLNYLYFNAATDEYSATAKILAVLGDTPNSTWLTYGTNNIDTNKLQVPQNDTENRMANSVIQDIVAQGDDDTPPNRWLFGIYEEQEAYYEQVPEDYSYIFRQVDPKGAVEDMTGAEVKPWLIRPGKWILLSDYLVGRSRPTTLRDDERSIFIESVTYTAPDDLSITGGNTDTLGQLMAQMGLGGVAS